MTKRKGKKKAVVTKKTSHSFVRWLWLLILAGLIFSVALFIMIAKTQLPETSELENPRMEIATQILADDSRELGKAFKLNREWITFDKINPHVVNALVATEDERYFKHSGIDARGTLRALVFMGKKGGASTITQQLAKLFFTQRSNSFPKRVWQKLKEWTIAIQFEKRYTKEEILAMYLNKYDFLYSANGISAASKTYFGKDQSKLSIDEAAVLVGMLKNPSIYNPKRFMDNAIRRRNVVMMQMVKNDKLKKETYNKLKEKAIDLSGFRREEHYDGVAPYFRATVVKEVKKLLGEDKYKKPDGTKYNIYTDGLKIYTTIDLDIQKHAEAAANEHMSSLQAKYFNRWKGKDPWTYDADDAQKKLRTSNLNSQVRDSDRFRAMRNKYLSSITRKISEEIDNVRLWDGDIFRLFTENKKSGHLAKLVRRKTITRAQSAVYKKILASDHWPILKKQWLALQSASKKAFNTKVKMKVFAYNNAGEKPVTMTPMDSIKYHNQHMQMGSISVDPKTGYVRAWIGGVGHKYFQYDHVKSNRQVGSTFKPLIYATAIVNQSMAMSPCSKVQDIQYVIPAKDPKFGLMDSWAPSNANGKFSGEYLTLKEGLKQSKNSVSLYLMKEIGNVELVRSLAEKMGINKDKVPSAPSICLGVPELSAMDLAGAYTTFADNGMYHKPVYIKRIEDKNGRLIYTSNQSKRRVFSKEGNYVMVDMLKNAASFISGWFESEVAGKTGTTNDYRDGWFVGVTPDLVTATWVGGDTEWIRFLTLADGQGGVMARPYFTELLKKIESDPNVNYNKSARFEVPSELNIELNCSLYDDMQPKPEEEQKMDEEELELEDDFLDEELDIDE